ncbi:ABC transporter permease [Brucella sp. IR073]|uniref:ABC transporter permease n=1 Tax=unclassified Brucella TaxID=2632610 RepID=UPI003B985B5B
MDGYENAAALLKHDVSETVSAWPAHGIRRDDWRTLLGREINGMLKRLDLAIHLAWSDTRARYRRSVLGPFWLVLGTLIGVGGLGFVWGALFDVQRDIFIPTLSIGLVSWYLLSACFVEAASVFYMNRDLLLNIPVSSLFVSTLLLFRQLINFAHNFVVVVIVLAIYPQHLSFAAIWMLPGLVLVGLNLLCIIQLVGYIGARYRDLAPLIAAIMQPLFFITPVLFLPSQLGARAFITEFNPFTYWLSLIRDPLMGVVPPATTWLIVIAMTIAGWSLALILTALKRQRLAYWVN